MIFRSAALVLLAGVAAAAPTFKISFPKERSTSAIDGRLLLVLSTDPSAEPRMQINDTPGTQMIFGVDVSGLAPGQPATVDASAFGYPVSSLARVKPGAYYVQAVLHRYETFHRADGHTVKLPMDRGEGQHWNLAPGNFYNAPQKIEIAANSDKTFIVELDREIPPIPAPKDTKFIRHLRVRSELLSKFWGRPMYLGANILVPAGFDEHAEAHYPLAVFEGHSLRISKGFEPSRRMQISNPTTASASTSPATTAFSRKRPTSFINNGPPLDFRASSSWKSSMRIHITMIPTPSIQPTLAHTAMPLKRN
jgi:hypothetical protein